MRVCAVCVTADGLGTGMTGGAENQVALLLSHLATRGHETTLVVPGLDDLPSTREGVRILSGWDSHKGARGLRAFTYRLPRLRQVLREVAADAFYIRGFSTFASSVVAAAHDVGACSLLALAHDFDLRLKRGDGGPIRRGLYERSLDGRAASLYYRQRGLRRASCVIAQTQSQLERCRLLGLRSACVSNIVEPPQEKAQGAGDGAHAVWVGSLSWKKGVEELAELVDRLHDVSFEIIGPVRPSIPRATVDRLLQGHNVRYLGELPHALVWERMWRSRILINTSPAEGFANVMLEAWAMGTPVVSLASNPDGLLSGDESLGLCAGGSLTDMASMIRRLLADDESRESAGHRAAEYVRRAHSPSEVCRQFEELVGAIRAGGREAYGRRLEKGRSES